MFFSVVLLVMGHFIYFRNEIVKSNDPLTIFSNHGHKKFFRILEEVL